MTIWLLLKIPRTNPISQSNHGGFEMLVLSRKQGESIVIAGGITITITKLKGNSVVIGIDAPKDVSIRRTELCERIRELAAA